MGRPRRADWSPAGRQLVWRAAAGRERGFRVRSHSCCSGTAMCGGRQTPYSPSGSWLHTSACGANAMQHVAGSPDLSKNETGGHTAVTCWGTVSPQGRWPSPPRHRPPAHCSQHCLRTSPTSVRSRERSTRRPSLLWASTRAYLGATFPDRSVCRGWGGAGWVGRGKAAGLPYSRHGEAQRAPLDPRLVGR